MKPGQRLLRACALLAMLPVAACATEAPADGGLAVRDSAGVTFLEGFHDVQRIPTWSVSPEPDVVMGTADGDESLYWVQGAYQLPVGGFVISDYGSHQLRFYSADGKAVRRVGREGSGPYEFEFVRWLQVVGDSIHVYDSNTRRLTVFDASGEPGRMQSLVNVASDGIVSALGVFGDGAVLGLGARGSEIVDVPGFNEYSRRHFVTRTDDTIDDLGIHFIAEQWMETIDESSYFLMNPPFGRTAVTSVRADRWYYTDGGEYRIEERTGADLRRVFVARMDRPRPQPSQVDSLAELGWGNLPAGEWPTIGERTFRKLPLPDRVPGYRSMLIDREGNVWAQPFSVVPGAACWHVFQPAAEAHAQACLPQQFTPFDIGGEWILGVTRDELDVERVVRYGLVKDARSGDQTGS